MKKVSILKKHSFSDKILGILKNKYPDDAEFIFENSPIISYLNVKTKSAGENSKSRGSFANLYALYVLIEDYISKGYIDPNSDYSKYDGAKFSDLFSRQRELPFGSKLQNHALNSRLNEEFKKYFPTLEIVPIVRDLLTARYWIQEDLLKISLRDKKGNDRIENLAEEIIEIINSYIDTKKESFEKFLLTCQEISELEGRNSEQILEFVRSQLSPTVDARIFEIVSYAILKETYRNQTIWIGNAKETVEETILSLFKTGRTNANDGGIDFVMKPLGRFFQVTETIDVNKYFLDIDKVQKFPISFVIKTNDSPENIIEIIKSQAEEKYKIKSIIETYVSSIEEIINIPKLLVLLEELMNKESISMIMQEIITQSKVEFNYDDE